MECEVMNLIKIKDGFFLGDEATASNLDIIIQFKITHMINGAGQQIMNAWESNTESRKPRLAIEFDESGKPLIPTSK